jgi:hypothetical protein
MSASRHKRSDHATEVGPAADDPVLTSLRLVEAQYREMFRLLEQQRVDDRDELRKARKENETLSRQLGELRDELDQERRRVQNQRQTRDTFAGALKDIYSSLLGGNVYDLILKTCLTLTGATRGLYVTTNGQNGLLRVRAAVDVDTYPSASASPFIAGLCHAVLENERVVTCNELSALPEPRGDGEAFRNCLAAPVVLRGSLSGVVIVADKAGGEFDEDDADVLLSVGSHAAVALENSRLQREVQEAYLSIVTLLAETMAARNQQAGLDQQSGSDLARAVAERLGLSEYERSIVYYAALLHDIGNIGVSDGVLNKPGPLLDAERELIRAHSQIGHDLLREIPVLEAVAAIVRHHHERYDGTGYPDGLQGDEIPIAARIVAVVDAYNAMLAPRSYRPALTSAEACEELRRGAGSQFDPHVVDVFLAALATSAAKEIERMDEIHVGLPGLELRR